jgi:hypothetical protein
VAYHLDIADHERAYWDGLPLSERAKERVVEHLTNLPDEFRLDPANRPVPGAPYFVVRHVILDAFGDRRLHTLDFHIRDDKAAYGVLFIALIDHR